MTVSRAAYALVLVVILTFATGCTSALILEPHFQTTLLHPGLHSADDRAEPAQGKSGVIYRISEEQAFTTALEAYATLLPKQSLDDIVDGKWRGFNADLWAWMDHWSNRILVIPAVGTDMNGNDVRG